MHNLSREAVASFWPQGASVPLSLHFEDNAASVGNMSRSFGAIRKCLRVYQNSQSSANDRAASFTVGLAAWAMHLHTTEQPQHWFTALEDLLLESKLTWSDADASIDELVSNLPYMRPRGERVKNVHIFSAEATSFGGKFAHALVAPNDVAAIEEIVPECPSIESIIEHSMVNRAYFYARHYSTGPLNNLFLIVGCVLMKFHRYDEAIQYAAAATVPDVTKAGTNAPL
eukprot:SAG11_NODE_10223_length_846_cov_0.718876_1_plen_227_part_01